MAAVSTSRSQNATRVRSIFEDTILVPFLAAVLAVETVVHWLGGYRYNTQDMRYYRFWYPSQGVYRDWLLAPCEGIAALLWLVAILSLVPAVSLGLAIWLTALLVVVGSVIMGWSAIERSRNKLQRREQNFLNNPVH